METNLDLVELSFIFKKFSLHVKRYLLVKKYYQDLGSNIYFWWNRSKNMERIIIL